MPIRVTPQQWQALNDLRAEDGVAAQEHVRRAIDLYLEKKRKTSPRFTPTSPVEPAPGAETRTPGKPALHQAASSEPPPQGVDERQPTAGKSRKYAYR
jgi:hypothetical protein